MSEKEFIVARVGQITQEAKAAAEEIRAVFESVFDAMDALRNANIDDPVLQEALAKIYETGSVQDVLRQRMEKIVRIAARIEDPVLPEDDVLLSGPQSGEGSLSQDDVNRLLNE